MVELKDIPSHFVLPILLNGKTEQLNQTVIDDLELIQTNDSENVSIYHKTVKPKTVWGESLLDEWVNHYTTDTEYLKDTQKLLQNVEYLEQGANSESPETFSENLWTTWSKIKNDPYFKHHSGFIDFYMCDWLNESEIFLLCLSIYNMSSPVFAILFPFLMFLLPFFYLQLSGTPITMTTYLAALKEVSDGNAVGNLIFNFHDSKMEDRIYMCISACFYVFSFYQNFMFCCKFCNNLFVVNKNLMAIREHLNVSVANINHLSEIVEKQKLSTYHIFNQSMLKQKDTMEKILKLLQGVRPFKYDYRNVMDLGTVLKTYYVIFQKEENVSALLYSFGLNGYVDILHGIKRQIDDQKLGVAKFKSKSTVMKKAYYAGLIDETDSVVRNDITYKKNILLTGPNASGKTTILKASLINIIFTQQFGYGCYASCTMKPYDVLHCYINISDSIGRDSLFQTESKKCRAILESLKSDTKRRHFCAFDELFSGTNPGEAVKCGHGYLRFLNKEKQRVDFILTTHYNDLCNKFVKSPQVDLLKMNVVKKNEICKYEYLLKEGVNDVDGGVEVLKQLDFPEEIIKFVSF